ncbi:septation ring formation regulator EzrA [Evansella sp. AB-rgal1]|uniref:septation ring formation regulator EzrA n=1 Tax=Evansella sp. AB-rgal1 TaxID=3242696 RepID=UPI00359E762D
MEFVYGLIVLVLIVFIYGAWFRKRIYKEVDRLDNEKIQLLNEPVTEQLSKIKGLTMLGETEERFEQWRNNWDEIVTIKLPDIEEKIFDIEEFANKYRFNKAKKIIKFVDDEILNIKTHLEEMIKEIELLVESEEQNREDIHDVKEAYEVTKEMLRTQKGSLGGTVSTFERNLTEIKGLFASFDEETEKGNYLQAREVLLEIKSELDYIQDLIPSIPHYLLQLEKELPKQMEELENGITELNDEGYPMEHFTFKRQLSDMKRRLLALIPLVEHLKLDEASGPMELIQKEIDDIYEKLEYEVISKQFVERELPTLQERVSKLPFSFQKLRSDTETVKMSYRISEEEDRKQLKMEKMVKELVNQFYVILDSIDEKKQSFTAIRQILIVQKESIEKMEEEMNEIKGRLDHLRSDERSAEETILKLRRKLIEGQKQLKRSNLPGVPESLIYEIDVAEKLIIQAAEKLNELPLSIDEIVSRVDDAKVHVDKCVENLTKVIEKASLAEQVIQYGNRFRSQYDEVNIRLLEAEDYFRHSEYSDALEVAITAIEPIDPNVLEKVSGYSTVQ